MRQSEKLDKYLEALQRAKSSFDPILKDATNPHFKSKYATLSAIIAATDPHLTANGLQLIQHPLTRVEGSLIMTGVQTQLFHVPSEQFQESELLLPIPAADVQKAGGAITYARRYARLAILDLAAEDDDGECTVRGPKRESKEKTESTKRTEDGISFDRKPFYQRATAVTDKLVAAGLPKNGAGAKVKSFLLRTTGKTELLQLSAAEWSTALAILEKQLEANAEKAIELVGTA